MARRRTYNPLNVFVNSRQVGVLEREKSGAINFIYVDSWLDWHPAFPISISLPLREDRYIGAEVTAVFENLLPDYEPIRKRVAERVGANGTDAFSLLTEIGRDCIGALQFIPDSVMPQPSNELTGRELSDTDIGNILNQLDVTPLGIRRESEFRISIAGAQDKTALLFHQGQWIEPTGATPTTHIIKPQIGKLSSGMDLSKSVENEFLCMKLMESFGLKTAHVEIAQFDKHKALIIERFDRKWSSSGLITRLPQEDCCQALSIPPTRKYQSEGGPGIVEIMNILGGSDEPGKDRYDFFKAQILFWLIGATDGHAKNFSLALSSQGRFRTTPLYDVLTLQPSYDKKQIPRKDFKMAMRVGRSNQYNVENIVGRHFQDTGVQSGLSRQTINDIFEDISTSADSALQKTADSLPDTFPKVIFKSVSEAIKSRLPKLHAN
ncbi:MAG: type II toxin-antitoxin system HipA family toxin [Granulosicoccus sp.]